MRNFYAWLEPHHPGDSLPGFFGGGLFGTRVASASTPLDYFGSALWGWWDASDISTLFQDSAATTPVASDTDPVGYWGDKSGNARHGKQTTAGNRPTYAAAHLNGLGGIDFVKTSFHHLNLDNPATLTDLLIGAVIKNDGGGFNKVIIAGNTNAARLDLNATDGLALLKNGVAYVMTQATAGTTARTVVSTYQSGVAPSDAGMLHRMAGADVKTADTTSTFSANISRIGAGFGTDAMDGKIYELVVLNRLGTLTEAQWLEAYFLAKWGVS